MDFPGIKNSLQLMMHRVSDTVSNKLSISRITCSKTHFVLENRKFSLSQGSVALYGCKSDVAAVLPGIWDDKTSKNTGIPGKCAVYDKEVLQ